MRKPTEQSNTAQTEAEVGFFIKSVWFYLFYFALLLMIASFGLIAET